MSKRKHGNADWNKFREKLANKRKGKGDKSNDEAKVQWLTIQCLLSSVEGKCQKYGRIGPLKMVEVKGELTLEAIRIACKKAFHIFNNFECDLLAGERGPSYTDMNQIKNFKLTHVRFVEKVLEAEEDQNLFPPAFCASPLAVSKFSVMSSSKSEHGASTTASSNASVSTSSKSQVNQDCVPSISLTEMLKVGKFIAPDASKHTFRLSLEEFSIDTMSWQDPFEACLLVEKMPFANGAFRNAFLAKSLTGLPSG
eukprot:gene11552-12744_t